MYYVAFVVRSINNSEGKIMHYLECMSDKDEEVVDDKLVKLSQERMANKSAPPYFYRRAEGESHNEAVTKCIEKIEQACEDESIDDPSDIQGMYDLLPSEKEKEPEEVS